jgi:N-acetylmuramoyl-L-alanine amidase
MHRVVAIGAALLAVITAAVVMLSMFTAAVPRAPGAQQAAALSTGIAVLAGAPLPMLQDIDPEDLDPTRDTPGERPAALAPPGRAIVQADAVRIPKPALPTGPRRVGIQAGHVDTAQVPLELGTRIIEQTGASWAGIDEVSVNLDIAERIKAQLTARGYIVDILPTTVPAGYLADVFVALHADGDITATKSGFKIAHAARRGPYEATLVRLLRDEYAKGTGLEWDETGITRNMLAYYPLNWGRYQHAAAPHTPAAILEMGFLTHDADRELMVDRPDLVASAIVAGIQRFLDEVPRSRIFAEDIIVPR